MGDRVVETGRRTTVGELVAALDPVDSSLPAVPSAPERVRSLRLERTGAVLDPDRPLARLDLRSGDRVGIVAVEPGMELDAGPDPEAKPSAALRMLTGPLAGETFELPAGSSMVGRTADNDLVLKDPGISRHHARITVDATAVAVVDLGSTNGIRIEGLPIDGPTALRSGQRLLLGQSWVAVDHHGVPVVPVDGRIGFDRPQRLVPTYQGRIFQVPRRPDGDDRYGRRGPLGSRMQSRGSDRAYNEVIDHVVADINLSRREERTARVAESPSIDEILLGVRSRTRLWERRLTDPDALQVRLGLAELPSRHRIEVEQGGPMMMRNRLDRLPQTYATIDGVPATLDLGRPGGLRLRGPLDRVQPIAAALVAQLVGLNPPDQLGLVLHGDRVPDWDWLKWLPHVDLVPDQEPPTGEEAAELVSDLLAADPASRTEQRHRPPYVVVIVDGVAADDELLARLQTEGASRGVHPLIVEESSGVNWAENSAFGVGAVLTVDGPTARLHVPGDPSASVDPIAVEPLTAATAVELGRLLAPLTMGRLETVELDGDSGSESVAGAGSSNGDGEADGDRAAPSAEAPGEGLDVRPLVFGPIPVGPDPLAAPDLFDLPRSADDTRLVLGEVRIAGEPDTILAFSPPRDGTLALVGTSSDDLTGCLVTVVAAAARFDGPPAARPRVYAIGPRSAFRRLAPLPVLAGLVGTEPSEAVDCLAELEQLMADRLVTFELAGVSDLDGFRAARPGIPLQRVLVIIDGLGWLTSMVEAEQPGRTRQVIGQLLEIGSALGLHLVFTVDDRNEVDPLLAPKVGRWLELEGEGGVRGRVLLDGADVQFAPLGGSWVPERIEQAIIRLVDETAGDRTGDTSAMLSDQAP